MRRGNRITVLTALAIWASWAFMGNRGLAQRTEAVVLPDKSITRARGDGGVRAIAFGDDNKTVAVALSGKSYRVLLCDAETGTIRHTLDNQPHVATQMVVRDKGLNLFTGCSPSKPERDVLITRWDVNRGQETGTFILPAGGWVHAISQDCSRVITARAYPQRLAKVWEIPSAKETTTLDGGEELHNVYCAAFSPDGKVIGVGGGSGAGGILHLWSGDRFTVKRRLQPEGGVVQFVTFSPKGDLVALGTHRSLEGRERKGGLEICELPSGKWLSFKLFNETECCQFAPDGVHIAVSAWQQVELWNVRTGKRVAKFTDARGGFDQFLAFSPDGKTLAGCGNQRDIHFWKVPKLDP